MTPRNSETLLEVVPRFMHLIRTEMRVLAEQDLTVPQYRILANLRGEERTSTDLAEWLGVSLPAMSRMVDLLVGKGLLERKADPDDRRQTYLRLTAAGRGYYDRIRRAVERRLEARLKALSRSESQTLAAGLEVLGTLLGKQDRVRDRNSA